MDRRGRRRCAGVNPWLRLLRPEQWVKNIFVLAALVFSMRFLDPSSFVRAWIAFAVFCLASSACYLLNDIVDADRDRRHPEKADRPIASGEVAPGAAALAAALLALAAISGAFALHRGVGLSVFAYLVLQTGYSFAFKRVVGLDAVVIAFGFVLRTVAGVFAVGAEMSRWLFLATFTLALFLALAKRRHELVLLGDEALDHRDVLGRYADLPLDGLLVAVAAAVAGVYAQYTLRPEVGERLGTDSLYLTVPFVVLGLFRYLYLVYRRDLTGNPTTALLIDRPLQASVALWAATVLYLLYA
jgi:4-hydroxybenzoate polyprenyltransferase